MKTWLIWIPALAVLVGIAIVSGCAIDEIVTVDVPRGVQQEMGVGDTVTLREARRLREQMIEQQAEKVRSFDQEIADGAWAEEFASSAVNDILPIAVPAVGTLPGGAILATLLAGVAGRLTRTSGDKRRTERAEHEAAIDKRKAADEHYDMGRAEALDTINKAGVPK